MSATQQTGVFQQPATKSRGWQITSPCFYSYSICAQAASAERVQRVAGSASAETVPAAAGYSYAARAAALIAALRAPVLLKQGLGSCRIILSGGAGLGTCRSSRYFCGGSGISMPIFCPGSCTAVPCGRRRIGSGFVCRTVGAASSRGDTLAGGCGLRRSGCSG